ncbi:MAG: AmmeMemoRadiSam system protein B [Elusimicrobia bacterium]|nr:AmmeMemoRadiSam system protein B [Elusimicrobiota bacterium]
MIRKPAVRGMFYPEREKDLRAQVLGYMSRGSGNREKAKGIMVPHAGYIYSGKVAGLTYSRVAVPDKIIIVGPNHTGLGTPVSVMSEGEWEMPGGNISIDAGIAGRIISASSYAEADTYAHLNEHSLEVQLPFLLYSNMNMSFVPVVIGTNDGEILEDVGRSIAEAVEGEDALIVASSDMSHYVSQAEAEKYDRMAIDRILELDREGLLKVVRERNISMCGAGPVAAVIEACLRLGARESELVHYNTSAEASGDRTQVVGYAGVIFR